MNAVVEELKQLPAPVARRGIQEADWRTAMNSLFPGAKPESVLMVFDYCKARKLDPLKKPCHIVPIQVKAHDGDYIWRDVVMPGIYEYRTTATRTGFYLGHTKPEYGPLIDHLGTTAPEWCDITVYRWNPQAKIRAEFPVRVKFVECAATRRDKKSGQIACNDRWNKAPQQMLTKCAEAAALREAFPDEFGGTHTAEEMEGQETQIVDHSRRIDPRPPDVDIVDFELRDKHVSSITDILNFDKEEHEIAEELRTYVADYLEKFPELYVTVCDRLAEEGIVSKKGFREIMKSRAPGSETRL